VQVNSDPGGALSAIVLASDFASPSEFSLSRSGNNLQLTFQPVPEPAFVTAVFAAGLAGAAGLRRRRLWS
jgi:MYXO-CTERM domain-containing protein